MTTRRGFLGVLAGAAAALGLGVRPKPERVVEYVVTDIDYENGVVTLDGPLDPRDRTGRPMILNVSDGDIHYQAHGKMLTLRRGWNEFHE
jgi:hypothetical protein